MSDTINLLHTKTSGSPHLTALESQLLIIAYWVTGSVLGVCLILLAVSLYFKREESILTSQKESFIARVSRQKQTEGLLLAIKQRVTVADRVAQTQKPWVRALDIVTQFADPSQLGGIAVDEAGRVQLHVASATFAGIAPIITVLAREKAMGNIREAQLSGLQINDKGGIEIGVAFIPNF
jgi:hypothetical protein